MADLPLVWSLEPLPLSGLLTLCLLYALAVGPLRGRLEPGAPFPVGRALGFGCGLLVLAFVLVSPLHVLAESYLLSAHMLQLALLVYLAPPLLIAGTPPWLLRQGLSGRVQPLLRGLTRPALAFVLFQLAFITWHLPPMFRLILAHDLLHGLAYLALFAAALVMWWPLLSPLPDLPPAPPGVRALYALALILAHLPVMAFVGAGEPYPWYAQATRSLGLSPEADKELAGMLMMAATLLALLPPLGRAAASWLAHADATPAPSRD